MKALRVQIGEFWCPVLDEKDGMFQVRDPLYYVMSANRRPRRPPRIWVPRWRVRQVTYGQRSGAW